jgi:hypothetical protein
MPDRPMPYADEDYDVNAHPNEVRPTANSPRLPLLPPKPNVVEDAFTRSGIKFAERLAEAANIGRDTDDHIGIDDIPEGLVRAFEAADAAPAQNVSNLASGAITPLSTGDGELLIVEAILNPMAIIPDPMNGRTMLGHVSRRSRLLTPTCDDAQLDLPVFDLEAASELIDMANASHTELGFRHPRVAPGKDFQDLVSIGLQGVHEPILVTPQVFRGPDGSMMHGLVADDGNRRIAMQLKILADVAGFSAAEQNAWATPMWNGTGYEVRDWTAADVNRVRQRSLIGAETPGTWFPRSGNADDIDAFLNGPAMRSVRIRSFLRSRVVRAQIVVGVNNATLSPAARSEASSTNAVVKRIVRRRHITEAAQKPWDESAQSVQVATSALLGIRDAIGAAKDFVPLTAPEISSVLDGRVAAWSAADIDAHPLRLAAKLAATLICEEHDGTSIVRSEMKSFNMSTHHSKIADNRARIAADRVMPLLGFDDPGHSRTKQVRSVIDRAARSRVWQDVKSHPGGVTDPWWRYLDCDSDELAALADAETGVGSSMGPASRALAFKALLCLAASPAVASSSSKASPFTITLNGLGGTRGETKTTPDLVILKVLDHPQGVAQLAEIVAAGETSPPRLALNVVNPDAELDGDPSTRGFLTEHELRGPTYGWQGDDADGLDGDGDGSVAEPDDPTPTPYVQYLAWQEHFTALLHQLAAEAKAVTDGADELIEQFNAHGLPNGGDLLDEVNRVIQVVSNGKFIAGRNSG